MDTHEKSALVGRRSETKPCPRCGAAFVCGIAAGESRCWCADLPAILPPNPAASCYCPACLKFLISEVTRPGAGRRDEET
jgi:hypothetical protein